MKAHKVVPSPIDRVLYREIYFIIAEDLSFGVGPIYVLDCSTYWLSVYFFKCKKVPTSSYCSAGPRD